MNENPPSAAGIIFIAGAILIMSCLQGCASGHDNAAAADNGAPAALSNQRVRSRAAAPAAQHGTAQEGVIGIAGHAIGDVITFPLSVFNGN